MLDTCFVTILSAPKTLSPSTFAVEDARRCHDLKRFWPPIPVLPGIIIIAPNPSKEEVRSIFCGSFKWLLLTSFSPSSLNAFESVSTSTAPFSAIMLHLSLWFTLVWSFWTLSQAAPSPESSPTLTKREAPPLSTACGDIVRDASMYSLIHQVDNLLTRLGINTFKADLVYECLTSVPFNPAVATRFIKYLNDSLQFQSTLAYLKTPPAGYQQPPVDLLGGLERIQALINTGSFENQYEFEATLQSLVYLAHDHHLSLAAGILGIFSFGTSYRIASVSIDGIQLPKIYLTGTSIASIPSRSDPN
jgi:hypothetical protein